MGFFSLSKAEYHKKLWRFLSSFAPTIIFHRFPWTYTSHLAFNTFLHTGAPITKHTHKKYQNPFPVKLPIINLFLVTFSQNGSLLLANSKVFRNKDIFFINHLSNSNKKIFKIKFVTDMNKVWLINSFVKEKIGLCSLDRRFCGLTHSAIADMVPLARRYQSLHYTFFLFLQTGSAVLDLQVALGAVFQCGWSSVEEVCDDSDVWSDFDVCGVVTGVEPATVFHNSI